jgi:uncharacterized protein YggE
MGLLKKISISYSILFILPLFGIALSAAAAAAVVSAQTIVLSNDDKPSLSVTGIAEKQIPTDQSKISLAVENTASDSSVASKTNAEKINKILSALETKGLNNKNISTASFEIRPNYDNQNNNNQKILSYTAINKILLTTSSNVNISSFVDLALSNGANRVENIEFISSQKIIDENYNDLLKQAFNNAKQKAEILSTQGDFLLNGVKKIDVTSGNDNNPSPPIPYYSFNAAQKTAADSSPLTQILPQENKLTVSLPVTFYIQNNVK